MRVPSPQFIETYARRIVIFLLGMIVGASTFLYMYGKTMDDIMLENKHLTLQTNNMQDEINSLTQDLESLRQQQQPELSVKNIELDVLESDVDNFTESEILERLNDDLKFIIQLPLDGVADTAETLIHLVNGKKYSVDQQEASIELVSIVVYTTVKFKIRIKKET